MRSFGIVFAGTALALGLAIPAQADAASSGGAAQPTMGKGFSGKSFHRWGPRFQGRWVAGWRAPGSWAGYRRPVIGYVLPSYWINPAYRIGNYAAYGLPVPAAGYGWSRYYDDAVMTDRDGRVTDHRSGVKWDSGDHRPPSYGAAYDDDVTMADAPPPHEYEVRRRDDKGHAYSDKHEGRFEREARSNYGVDYDAPHYAAAPYAPAPQVTQHGGPGAPLVTTTHAPGYYANGYYYPGPTTTTIVIRPR